MVVQQPARRFRRSATLNSEKCGGTCVEGAVERLETENRVVCRNAGRAGTLPDFLSRFLRADVSRDQRSAARRTLHPASPAHAALRHHGRAWLAAGLLVALFHCEEGRGSVFPQKSGPARARRPVLGREEWICWDADRGAPATTHALQDFRACRGRV